jgi:hypothetical protein
MFGLSWLCVLDGSRGLLQHLVHDLTLNEINKMGSIFPISLGAYSWGSVESYIRSRSTCQMVTAVWKIALVRSFSGLLEIRFFDGLNSELDLKTMRIIIFNIVVLLSQLGSLMICTHDLYVLTKRKRNDSLLQIIQIRWPRRSRQLFLSF